MTTLPMPQADGRADAAGRVLTGAAGLLLLGGLALALADAVAASLAATGAGIVLALFVLGPRAVRAARRRGALLAAAVVFGGPLAVMVLMGLAATGASVASLVAAAFALLPPVVIVLAATGGLVLVADDLRTRLRLAQRAPTPWQRLAGSQAAPGASPWRAFRGLALIGLAVVLTLAVLGGRLDGRGVLLLVVLIAGALAVVGIPLVVAALARADHSRADDAREDERRRVAAHLHDSVLQTLALVQRQAHDPAAVTRLARRQEHALRTWMAGEAELGSETLAAALRNAAAEVEDEHAATVELTILGDRPLDRQSEALAAAAREALRNAARHAPGAPIYLFAQAGPDGVEVFVRDEGPSFDLASVPTERRGVRDSVVGRMAAAGGEAIVDSRPGEGTEIALRFGVVA